MTILLLCQSAADEEDEEYLRIGLDSLGKKRKKTSQYRVDKGQATDHCLWFLVNIPVQGTKMNTKAAINSNVISSMYKRWCICSRNEIDSVKISVCRLCCNKKRKFQSASIASWLVSVFQEVDWWFIFVVVAGRIGSDGAL